MEVLRIFFCGEILPHRTAKALVNRFPSATIYNTYGPTEATVAVTSIQITQEILDQYPTLPVGVERPGQDYLLQMKVNLLSKVKV